MNPDDDRGHYHDDCELDNGIRQFRHPVSSQAGLSTLRAGVPAKINSAASKGMTPTQEEAARMYRIADEAIGKSNTSVQWVAGLMEGVAAVLRSDADDRAKLAALHRLAGAWEAGAS